MPAPIIMMSKQVQATLQNPQFIANNLVSFQQRTQDILNERLTHGTNLERINQVLSLRIGIKARLLAIKRIIAGQLVWVLLELLPNHEYSKARYLKPRAKDKFLENNKDRMMALALSGSVTGVLCIDDSGSDDAVMAGVGVDRERYVKPNEVVVYNSQLIHLTDKQDDCLAQIAAGLTNDAFIALIAGAPGSGKTLLAKIIIEQLLELEGDTASVYYIAQSEKLRHEMAKQCGALAGDAVNYCAYQQMLEHAGVNFDGMTQVDDVHLLQYFAKAQNEASTLHKIKIKDAAATGADIEAILKDMSFEQFQQECLVMSGINKPGDKGLAEYLAMGGNHSLFHGNTELQQRLWHLYQNYMAGLAEANQYHLQLSRFDVEKIVGNSTLVVDEALDLTRVQLQAIMAMGAKVVFLGDHNQELKKTSQTVEYLRELIAASGVTQTYVAKLNKTYRCAAHIATIASKLLVVKKGITSHGSDLVDIEVKSAVDATGSVAVIGTTASEVEQVKRLCSSVDTAVICPQEKKATVAEQLSAALVFSIAEIKGLGYKRVILRDVISRDTAVRLLGLIRGGKKKRGEITAEDKMLITQMNNVFTAVSRAESELVFMNSDNHPKVQELIAMLVEGIDLTMINVMGIDTGPSTETEWRAEALRLRAEGKHGQADEIARQHDFVLESDAVEAPSALDGIEAKRDDEVGPTDRYDTRQESQLVVSQQPVRVQSRRKRKSKKRPKPVVQAVVSSLPLAEAIEVQAECTAKADAVSCKGEGNPEFIVAFEKKLKGQKGKKKEIDKRQINFSMPITLDNLDYLASLSARDMQRIMPKHIMAMLMVSGSFDANTLSHYLSMLRNVEQKSKHPMFHYSADLMSSEKMDELVTSYDLTAKNTIAYKLMLHKDGIVFLQNYLLPLLVRMAGVDDLCCRVLAQNIQKPFYNTSNATILVNYIRNKPGWYLELLELANEKDTIRQVIVKSLNIKYLQFSHVVGGRGMPRALSALYVTFHERSELANKLLDMAFLHPDIRSALVAGLGEKAGDSGVTPLEAFYYNPDTGYDISKLIHLAELHPECMSFLADKLSSISNQVDRWTLLHELARRCPQSFKRLAEIAQWNDSAYGLFIKAFTATPDRFMAALCNDGPAPSQVVALALSPSHEGNEIAKIFISMIRKLIAFHDNNGPKKHVEFINYITFDCDSNCAYAAMLDFITHNDEAAAAFCEKAVKISLIGSTFIHQLVTGKQDAFVQLVELAIARGGIFNVILAGLDKVNDEGCTPMALLRDRDESEYRRLTAKITAKQNADRFDVNPALTRMGMFINSRRVNGIQKRIERVEFTYDF
ncbi:MAG: AAA family ATPase [Coxiellaceae bacterium]|nr:AAA family ATPase [Coxiellaceae bacterium]